MLEDPKCSKHNTLRPPQCNKPDRHSKITHMLQIHHSKTTQYRKHNTNWTLMLQSHTAGFWTGSIRYQNRIDPVSPALIRIVTRVNSWGFRDYNTAKKRFGSCSKIFCKYFNSVSISVLNRFELHRPASTRSVKPHRPLSYTAWHS
jgi:hypothetical protein